MGSALAWVIDVHGRKVLHLLLGDVEPDSVLDSGHGADRDGDLLAPPQMPLPEQHVGNPVVLRIDEQALHQADLTIEGMDVLTGTHLYFTRRDNLLDNEPAGRGIGEPPGACMLRAPTGPGLITGIAGPASWPSTRSLCSAWSSSPNSARVQRSLIPPDVVSIRSRGQAGRDAARAWAR
jgi:hypothetical protein